MDGSAIAFLAQANFHGALQNDQWPPWHTLNRRVQICKQAEAKATELVYKTLGMKLELSSHQLCFNHRVGCFFALHSSDHLLKLIRWSSTLKGQ